MSLIIIEVRRLFVPETWILDSGIRLYFRVFQTFLLQVTKVNVNETTTIDKTVPCFGSTTHTCLVQVSSKPTVIWSNLIRVYVFLLTTFVSRV